MQFRQLMTRRVLGIPIGLLLIILFSRLFILGTMAVGRAAYPTVNLPGSWMAEENHPFRDYLANFDGAWFIRVAAIGYEKLYSGDYDWRELNKELRVLDERGYLEGKAGFGYRHIFVFPYMMRLVQPIFRDWVISGLAIVAVFSLIFQIYLYLITKDEFGEKAAWWAVILVSFSPAGHYLVALYTEGLMLAGIGSYYHFKKNQFVLAALLGAFCASVRLEGFCMAIPMFFLMVQQEGVRKALLDKRILVCIVVCLGIFVPFLEFWRVSGDPFTPYLIRKSFGGAASMPWESFISDFKHMNPVTLFVDIPVLLLTIFVVIVSLRRLSLPFQAFILIALLGRLIQPHMSLLRFMLPLFTIWMYLGDLAARKKMWRVSLLIVFVLLLIFFCIKFINGYWIA